MTKSERGLPRSLEEVHLIMSRESALAYAELTADENPIHLDDAFAAATPFGRTIAHGTMSIGLVLKSLAKTFDGERAPGAMEVRFVQPIFIGQTVRAGGTLLDETAGIYEVFAETVEGERTLEGIVRLRALAGGEIAKEVRTP